MPNDVTPPWKMFLPLAIVILLGLLWSAYWLVAFNTAKARFAAERQELAAQGMSLTCEKEEWGGFPFHFEYACTSPTVVQSGQAEIRSARLLLVALAYAPWQVAALIDGPTNVRLPGLRDFEISHQRALAAVTFGEGWKPSFSAELPAVSIATLGTASKLTLFTRPAQPDGTDIALGGTQISYRPAGKPALDVDTAELLGTLQPDLSFKIDRFEAVSGTLRFWGSGMLSVDGQHRISGQIDTETNDIKALLAMAGPQFGLSDDKLGNLRTMLGLLGNGAKAPIIMRDGALYIGPFLVTELTPLY